MLPPTLKFVFRRLWALHRQLVEDAFAEARQPLGIDLAPDPGERGESILASDARGNLPCRMLG